jgi:hypothetical protein
MQPVQLSLLPDSHPATPAALVEQLPAESVATAITLLAGLIASLIAEAGVPAGMEAAADD